MILLTVHLAERILIDALMKYLSTRKQPLPLEPFTRDVSKYPAFVVVGDSFYGN